MLSVLAPEDRAEAGGERKVTVRFDDQPELEASSRAELPISRQRGRGLLRRDAVHGNRPAEQGAVPQPHLRRGGLHRCRRGIAHVGGDSFPLRAGSCFHLPPDEVHCIENTGYGPMQILGVFHPSGSPANRTYQDNK